MWEMRSPKETLKSLSHPLEILKFMHKTVVFACPGKTSQGSEL
jgi:hypothetical protein